MPQDMKVWRRKARLKLIADLGGKCVGWNGPCPHNQTDPEKLKFEHKTPLTEEQQNHRERIGVNMRMVQNRKEAAEGLLQLMCQSCNIRKSHDQTRTPAKEAAKNQTEDEHGNPIW